MLPDYDNTQKWWKAIAPWWRKPRTRVVLIVIAVGLLLFFFLRDYLPYRRQLADEQGKNKSLETKVLEQSDLIATLRHENQNLVSTKNSLESQLEIVRRTTKEVYPNMEVGAAIAEMAKAVKRLESDMAERMKRMEAQLVAINIKVGGSLLERYPLGYVLFTSERSPEVVSLAFPKEGLYIQANWNETRILPDFPNKVARLSIRQPRWTQGNKININLGLAEGTVPLVKGQSTRVKGARFIGRPAMFFELIDDNPTAPIFVIGFKIDDGTAP